MSKKFLGEVIATAFAVVCLASLLFAGGAYVSTTKSISPSPTVLVFVGDTMHGTAVHLGGGVFVTAKHNTAMAGLALKGQDGTVYHVKEVHAFANDVAFVVADGGPEGKATLACKADATPGVSVYTEGYPQTRFFQRYAGTVASYVWGKEIGEPLSKYLTHGQMLDLFVSPGLSGAGVFTGDYSIVGMIVALYAGQPLTPPLRVAVPASVICGYKHALDTRPH
mgnify:CR=1 FL=1